ncbi:MAG: tetratricopeptide (TPR) repeat protein [Arenicella sp.]|jgi:tetratricopeptide (TPR) repeat protein
MNDLELISAADKAFELGDHQRGLTLLRDFSHTTSCDAGSWHRLAVVEEQIGDMAAAGNAHYQCIQRAPHVALGYLYAAYWLQNAGKLDSAAAVYSLAEEADPKSLREKQQRSNQNRLRANSGRRWLNKFLSKQHRDLSGSRARLQRIQNSIWTRTHDSSFIYPESLYKPELFYIPQIRRLKYYPIDEFDWAKLVVKLAPSIKTELLNALSEQAAKSQLRPYLPANSITDGNLKELAGSVDWSALDLFKDGVKNQQIADAFPCTFGLIESLPLYSLDQQPFEVFFSLLKPQQTIKSHYGQSNHALTVHLPLTVPENCFLEVAGEKHYWRENELLVFDDSFKHSAHNLADQLRIVLIFSVWHPDLNPQEQKAIQLSFKTRQQWMQNRSSKLAELLQPAA